jgi:hypothetical protein
MSGEPVADLGVLCARLGEVEQVAVEARAAAEAAASRLQRQPNGAEPARAGHHGEGGVDVDRAP